MYQSTLSYDHRTRRNHCGIQRHAYPTTQSENRHVGLEEVKKTHSNCLPWQPTLAKTDDTSRYASSLRWPSGCSLTILHCGRPWKPPYNAHCNLGVNNTAHARLKVPVWCCIPLASCEDDMLVWRGSVWNLCVATSKDWSKCYSKTYVCVCLGDATSAIQQRRTRMLVISRCLDVFTSLHFTMD